MMMRLNGSNMEKVKIVTRLREPRVGSVDFYKDPTGVGALVKTKYTLLRSRYASESVQRGDGTWSTLGECGICLYETALVDLTWAFHCPHRFCVPCLAKWLTFPNSPRSCPLCRQPLLCSPTADYDWDMKVVRDVNCPFEIGLFCCYCNKKSGTARTFRSGLEHFADCHATPPLRMRLKKLMKGSSDVWGLGVFKDACKRLFIYAHDSESLITQAHQKYNSFLVQRDSKKEISN